MYRDSIRTGQSKSRAEHFCRVPVGVPIRTIRKKINAMGLRSARGRMFPRPTIHSILSKPAWTGTSVYSQRAESKWHRHTGGVSQERHDE